MRQIDRCSRRAPVAGSEPAGVAVRQHVDAALLLGDGAHQVQPVLADAAVDRHVLVDDLGRAAIGGRSAPALRQQAQGAAHLVERPSQVDGGRPRRLEPGIGRLQARIRGVGAHRQRNAIGGGRADQRRAAHQHVADRPRGVLRRLQRHGDELEWQPRLVDDADPPSIRFQPDRAPCLAVNTHSVPSPRNRRGKMSILQPKRDHRDIIRGNSLSQPYGDRRARCQPFA